MTPLPRSALLREGPLTCECPVVWGTFLILGSAPLLSCLHTLQFLRCGHLRKVLGEALKALLVEQRTKLSRGVAAFLTALGPSFPPRCGLSTTRADQICALQHTSVICFPLPSQHTQNALHLTYFHESSQQEGSY